MSNALRIIVNDFADFHDMRRVRPDTYGVYTVVFDRRWVVNIEADRVTDAVTMFGSAGYVKPTIYRSAEHPEIEWQAIGSEDLPFGGRIGIHYPTGVVMLDSRADPAHLDTVSFRVWLLAFVNQLSAWASQLGPRVRSERLVERMRLKPAPDLPGSETVGR